MLHSLKAKFTLAFGTLIVLLFTASGVFLIDSKSREISSDIAQTSLSFANFASSRIMTEYSEYLEPGNFLPFSRDIRSILRRDPDITSIGILNYSGTVLYDSATELEQQYTGSPRLVSDRESLDRIQSIHLSVYLRSGRTVYLRFDQYGNSIPMDINEMPVEDIKATDRIVNIIVPMNNSHALLYEVNYQSLLDKLSLAKTQIGLVTMFGLILTLVVSFMLSTSITEPIKDLKHGALKIATGDFQARVPVKTKDELGLLAQTFNTMAQELEVSTKALVYKERVAKELELAVQIQTNLLPKDKLVLNGLDIAGGLIPATEVGGDAFDYIKANDNQYITYLGDVTGHGVPAGIVSSIVNSLIYAFRSQVDLIKMVRDVNDVVRRKISSKVFVTMAITVWNEATRTLTYANAGHPPVLYYDSATKKITDVRLQGMAIGMIEDVEKLLHTQDFKMKPGDVFVMYSDGIVEANNLGKEQFGLPKLKQVVENFCNEGQTAEAIKNSILTEVIEFIAGGEYLDDMTVVVMKGK